MNERDAALAEAADIVLALEASERETANRADGYETEEMALEADRLRKHARELAGLAVSILSLGSPALSTRVAAALQRSLA